MMWKSMMLRIIRTTRSPGPMPRPSSAGGDHGDPVGVLPVGHLDPGVAVLGPQRDLVRVGGDGAQEPHRARLPVGGLVELVLGDLRHRAPCLCCVDAPFKSIGRQVAIRRPPGHT